MELSEEGEGADGAIKEAGVDFTEGVTCEYTGWLMKGEYD